MYVQCAFRPIAAKASGFVSIKYFGKICRLQISNFPDGVSNKSLKKSLLKDRLKLGIYRSTSASLGSAAKSVSSRSLTFAIASSTNDLASLGSAANSVSSRSATLATSASTSSFVARGRLRTQATPTFTRAITSRQIQYMIFVHQL